MYEAIILNKISVFEIKEVVSKKYNLSLKH